MKKGRPHMRTWGSHGAVRQQGWTPLPTQPPVSHPYLPLLALWVLQHPEKGDSIVELPELQEKGDLGIVQGSPLR